MNLEFGEIDILISDDKIYIIDVNNQPGDNAFHLSHIGFDSEDFRKYLCGKFMDYLTSKLW
jgi:predicted ATP-grasp superfamily ATP-dependent carboligase